MVAGARDIVPAVRGRRPRSPLRRSPSRAARALLAEVPSAGPARGTCDRCDRCFAPDLRSVVIDRLRARIEECLKVVASEASPARYSATARWLPANARTPSRGSPRSRSHSAARYSPAGEHSRHDRHRLTKAEAESRQCATRLGRPRQPRPLPTSMPVVQPKQGAVSLCQEPCSSPAARPAASLTRRSS